MSEHEYRLVFYGDDGGRLDEVAIRPDWEPAIEWARFSALRSLRLPAEASGERIAIRPVWDPRAGEPSVESFVVEIESIAARASSSFPIAYFRDRAEKEAERLVEKKLLRAGDPFLYAVKALRSPPRPIDARRMKFRVVETRTPFSARESRLSSFLGGAATAGDPAEEDFPFFVPGAVLEEATALCRAAAERGVETAGILAGYLRLDRSVPEAFVEATAQIPARHTRAEKEKVIFTPETWTDVRRVLARRNRGEIPVGWYHSHPIGIWGRESAEGSEGGEKSRARADGFFSSQDRLVHRAVFPAAFHLALVVTDPGDSAPAISCYGWRRGEIARRGFHATRRRRRGCGSQLKNELPRCES
jgi:hypothetical protein